MGDFGKERLHSVVLRKHKEGASKSKKQALASPTIMVLTLLLMLLPRIAAITVIQC